MKNLLMFVICAASLQSVASISCKKTSTNIWGYTSTSYIYCSYSCCGSYSSRYCCPDDTYYNGTGSIAGGIVGGIIFIVVVVAITVCICKHNNRSRGIVVAPARNQPNVVTVSQNQHYNHPYPQPATYPPPAYPPPAYPPPSTQVTTVY